MDKAIVITTINPPTRAIKEFAKWPGWQVIVVGDKKTPDLWYTKEVIYLGLKEQDEISFFSKRISDNTYARKMVGYIYAIKNGAQWIFETDDDNTPYEGASEIVERVINTREVPIVRTKSGWFNAYRAFGAWRAWPRGYPLDRVREVTAGHELDPRAWGVVQFLADTDSDFDAVYRMVVSEFVAFKKGKWVGLDEGVFCPWNSQSTLWSKEMFPAMFLPLGVYDRVMDILRSYIASTCAWCNSRVVSFASPIVYQERNKHNLLDDFEQEIPLYQNAEKWADLLRWSEKISVEEAYETALKLLCNAGSLPAYNVNLYYNFLKEIRGN